MLGEVAEQGVPLGLLYTSTGGKTHAPGTPGNIRSWATSSSLLGVCVTGQGFQAVVFMQRWTEKR